MGIVKRLAVVVIGAAIISFCTHFTLSLSHNHRHEKQMHMDDFMSGERYRMSQEDKLRRIVPLKGHTHEHISRGDNYRDTEEEYHSEPITDREIYKEALEEIVAYDPPPRKRRHAPPSPVEEEEDQEEEVETEEEVEASPPPSRKRARHPPPQAEEAEQYVHVEKHKFTSPFLSEEFRDRFKVTEKVKKTKRESVTEEEDGGVTSHHKVKAKRVETSEPLPEDTEAYSKMPDKEPEEEIIEVDVPTKPPKKHKHRPEPDPNDPPRSNVQLQNLDHRKCPPIFQEPDCKDLSKKFEKDFPFFATAFSKSLTLSQSSVKGYKSLITGVPGATPDATGKTVNLGPVSEQLLRILPKSEPAFASNFGTCAIIGSSGHLLKFKKGPEIDAHDMVFRFNSAPTKGFEQYVGARTTHRLTNTRNFGYRELKSEQVYVHLRNAGAMTRLFKKRTKAPGDKLYSLHPAWHRYMDKTFGYLTTSGLNGIVIGLHYCKHINLYGFHVHPQMGALYHYYNPNDVAANESRDDGEWQLVRKLVEGGYVHFAEPCIVECHDGKAACDACIESSKKNDIT